jgi:hypothetical protein
VNQRREADVDGRVIVSDRYQRRNPAMPAISPRVLHRPRGDQLTAELA